MPDNQPVRVPWTKVASFRLSRHHLSNRGPRSKIASVTADIGGAQAQVLSAAQMSIWARVKGVNLQDLESALWKERTLVRAWCMRRTLFLLPSDKLAVFIRGTGRRADYDFRWALARISSEKELDKLLDAVMSILKKPQTRNDIAKGLNQTYGYKLKSKAGGGWGNKRPVQWVGAGGLFIPVGYLLHIIGARDAICSGPTIGNESTYVRADKWLADWKDLPREQAEKHLLENYLSAFGPSTLNDFALWAGMYVRDARPIWEGLAERLVPVDVEGWKAHILESDLPELEKAEVDGEVVRLLPNFDSFLLGHKSHRNIVDAKNHSKVYRAQGWVSPVLLVDGQAEGVWALDRQGGNLKLRITSFTKISAKVNSHLRDEASDLGRFLGCQTVDTVLA